MEIRSLEYFVVAYESKSFTKAAKELHLTQQGLSKAIAGLEKEFGTPLFIRKKMFLQPTEFGYILYDKAKHLLEEYQKTVEELKSITCKKSELHIGFASNVIPVLNAETLIVNFKKQYPSTELQIVNLMDYECEEALLTHKIDAAFSMGPFSSSKIKSTLLVSESIHALLPVNHPLAEKDFLTIQDLEDEPLIISDSRNKGYARVLSFLQKECRHVTIVFQTSDPITHLRMVSKQMSISLFPNHFKPLFEQTQDVCILPILDMPQRNIYFISESQALKLKYVQQFIKFTSQFYNTCL